MEHTQDLNFAARDPVHNNIVRMYHHFARALHATDTIELWVLGQLVDPSIDRIAQFDRSNRIVLSDEIDDFLAIGRGNRPPANFQAFVPCAALAFFRSCVRFFAQRAETSACGMLGRESSTAACTWARNHLS